VKIPLIISGTWYRRDGRVEQGQSLLVTIGRDWLNNDKKRTVTCTGWKCSKLLDYGMAGDNVGTSRGLKREDVKRGRNLVQTWWCPRRPKFEAEVYALKKDKKVVVTR
jgi:translation elongation factor EF-Tu-like GTPase